MTFGQLSAYFAMLEELLSIGTAAAHAVSSAEPNSATVTAAVAHLDAFNSTVAALAPAASKLAEGVIAAVGAVAKPGTIASDLAKTLPPVV